MVIFLRLIIDNKNKLTYYLVNSWDDQQTIIIGSSTNGSLITYLPVGSINNCFKTTIQVNMTYNNNVINTFQINQNITVRPPYYNESIPYDYLANSNTTKFGYNLNVLLSIINYYSFIENNNINNLTCLKVIHLFMFYNIILIKFLNN